MKPPEQYGVTQFIGAQSRQMGVKYPKVVQMMAQDQALAFLKEAFGDEFVLHGSAAIRARGLEGARPPKDLDIYCASATTPEESVMTLRAAFESRSVAREDDGLHFAVMNTRHGATSGKVAVVMHHRLFRGDVSIDVRPLGCLGRSVEVGQPMINASSVGISSGSCAVVPLALQVGEKLEGMLLPQKRLLPAGLSSRYKDVVDLLVMARIMGPGTT